MKNLLCIVLGHKEVNGVIEDDEVLSTKGCARCKVPLRVLGTNAFWKGIRSIPCPGLSKESWGQYCDERENKIRNEVTGISINEF
jgi:hypothetical protein